MSRGTGRRDVQRRRRLGKRASLRFKYAMRRHDATFAHTLWSRDEVRARYPEREPNQRQWYASTDPLPTPLIL